jgi:hypothetical protein
MLPRQAISFAELPTTCYPGCAPTDALMALLNQAKKNGITKPFIFVDIGKFLPLWAMEVPSHSMCVHAYDCTIL